MDSSMEECSHREGPFLNSRPGFMRCWRTLVPSALPILSRRARKASSPATVAETSNVLRSSLQHERSGGGSRVDQSLWKHSLSFLMRSSCLMTYSSGIPLPAGPCTLWKSLRTCHADLT